MQTQEMETTLRAHIEQALAETLLPNWVDIGEVYMLAALTDSDTADGREQTQAVCDLWNVVARGGPISLTVSRAMREPGGRISGSTAHQVRITAGNVFEMVAGAASAMARCIKGMRAEGFTFAVPAMSKKSAPAPSPSAGKA